MRRILGTLVLAALLCGCGGTSGPPSQVQHQLSQTADSYTAVGDSITAWGYAPDAQKWPSVVGAAMHWSVSNYAVPGAQVFDIANQSFSTPTGPESISVSIIGQNENWFYDNQADAQYVPFLQALYVNRLIPDAQKSASSPATVIGDVIYVAVTAKLGSTYNLTVSIDGQASGPYAVTQPHTTSLGSTSSPYLVRLPVAWGSHSVSVTADATFQLLWIAGNGFARSTVVVPAHFAGNMYHALRPLALYQYLNPINQQAVSTLAGDGLNIKYVDLFTACGEQCGDADSVHPGTVGNPIIANSFLSLIRNQ